MKSEKNRFFLGLDIGFGDVKMASVCSPGNGLPRQMILSKLPTAIAYARDGIIGDLGKEQKRYGFNGRQYCVGTPALQCRDVFSTRDIGFLIAHSPLLAFAAVEKILFADSVRFDPAEINLSNTKLCLGMPIAHFHSKRAQLLETMKKSRVSDTPLCFDTIDVRAQGQGTFFDFVFDAAGHPIADHLSMTVLVVDVGFNTVDILGVVDGRPSREWSGMLEHAGISQIGQQVGAYLQREFNFDLPEQALKEVLRKKEISLYGATKDISWMIRKASEEYADWLIQEIRSKWEGFLKKADHLILAGGGAYYVADVFQSVYPQGFLSVPDKPEYSNAIGFQKYLEADHE